MKEVNPITNVNNVATNLWSKPPSTQINLYRCKYLKYDRTFYCPIKSVYLAHSNFSLLYFN